MKFSVFVLVAGIPTLIIHGEKDDDIRPDHAHRLFDALSTAQKQLIIISEGKHGDLRDKPSFLKAIRDFIQLNIIPSLL